MLQASSTNTMMLSGTKKYTELEIASLSDFYGAYFIPNVDRDFASMALFTLNKHFEKTLPVFGEIIKNPTFPQKEFETYINKKKQQFIVESGKVKTLAMREFGKTLFGESHPYGYSSSVEDFDKLKTQDLKDFHSNNYTYDNCKIIIAGNVNSKTLNKINEEFGNKWSKKNLKQDNNFQIKTSKQKEIIIPKKNAVQSALRIGRILFSRKHPDYIKMQVLNTVLGGYFGSRLMKNIREDKGYTYGIGSVVYPMKNNGYFAIVSEVNANVCRKAVNEVYAEIDKLIQTPIPETELQLVKNYMKGDMLKGFDGVFSIASKYRLLIENNLPENYFLQFFNEIDKTTTTDIQKLAQKYLTNNNLINIIAGKC
jgi:predicted Zn-dependent peptidase